MTLATVQKYYAPELDKNNSKVPKLETDLHIYPVVTTEPLVGQQ
jgi:hypothetical protein